MTSTLSSRLAALKHSVTPTPLRTFLALVNKADKECYVDYMAGAKALYTFLAPIDIPDYNSQLYVVPPVLQGYYLWELAKILSPRDIGEDQESWLARLARAEKAILIESLKVLQVELACSYPV